MDLDTKEKACLVKQKLEKFNLKEDLKYLVFTGAANYWHGVDYLVVLQGELNKIDSGIQIVCGGGKVSVADDPDTVLMNITPLDDKDCADLAQASDVYCQLDNQGLVQEAF